MVHFQNDNILTLQTKKKRKTIVTGDRMTFCLKAQTQLKVKEIVWNKKTACLKGEEKQVAKPAGELQQNLREKA